jgi:hypothetical protein
MWMLGETPEAQKVNRPVRKFSPGGRWLPPQTRTERLCPQLEPTLLGPLVPTAAVELTIWSAVITLSA